MKKKVLLGLTASLLSFGVLAEQVDFAGAAAGAMNFTGQATKSFQFDNTSVTTDTARVRFAAKANSPFPVGNYTSHVVVSCQ